MKKIKVGITGNSGFIGTHLINYLRTKKDEIEIIPFFRDFFIDQHRLSAFVSQCDVIVHLAAMTRGNADTLYNCNISLVKQLISSLNSTTHRPHIIFSSSIQEKNDNPYGRSKSEGKKLFEVWAQKNRARFTCLVIPNVFGPFEKPFFNSVITTWCYQLTHKLQPKIEIDKDLGLIYVISLIEKILEIIINHRSDPEILIPADKTMKLSEILSKLKEYQKQYFENSIIPKFQDDFEIALFNTFRSSINDDHFPVIPARNEDNRGFLVELVKELCGGQIFFSVTNPGITRGNHYHTKKIERCCVVEGEAMLQFRRIGTDKIFEYRLSGDNPGFVDIPIFFNHNITNIGRTVLTTLFWTNEIFDQKNPDTFYENVN
jgi:UDP-2-acetamido-2,6-beta-L-arabino-hexul-4-ose reductase